MVLFSEVTWATVLGLSLLFVGGFVLWVYGMEKAPASSGVLAQQDDVSRRFHAHLVRWFFLYGVLAVLTGVGFLLTAAVLVL
jgi:hypothetical protein